MEFHGLSDDQIFEKVAGEEPVVRVEALMHMGRNRGFDKVEESIGFYQAAYELADEHGFRAHRNQAAVKLAQAFYFAKRNADSKKVIQVELDREASIDDDEFTLGMLYGQLAILLAEEGDSDGAVANLDAAEQMLKTEDERLFLPTYFNKVTQTFVNERRYQLAANIGQRARSLAQEVEFAEELGMAYYFLARAYEGMNMLSDALKCNKEAFALLDHQSSSDYELWAKLAIARIHWLMGNFDVSLDVLRDLRSVAKSVAWAEPQLIGRVDLQIARNLLSQGKVDEAIEKFFKARALLRALGITSWAAVAEAEGAVAQMMLGNLDEAVASAESALRLWGEEKTQVAEFWVRLAYGKVMNGTSNYEAANAVLSQVLLGDLDLTFQPGVQLTVEMVRAYTYSTDMKEIASHLANIIFQEANFAISQTQRAWLYLGIAEWAVAEQRFADAAQNFGLAIQSFTADFNTFEVNRATARLIEVFAMQSNRAEDGVIEGL